MVPRLCSPTAPTLIKFIHPLISPHYVGGHSLDVGQTAVLRSSDIAVAHEHHPVAID